MTQRASMSACGCPGMPRPRICGAHTPLARAPFTLTFVPVSRSPYDEMILLNRAWEILRDPQMRAAYDWLEANRTRVAA